MYIMFYKHKLTKILQILTESGDFFITFLFYVIFIYRNKNYKNSKLWNNKLNNPHIRIIKSLCQMHY